MKVKKLAALAMACVVVAASGAVMAACNNTEKEPEKPSFVEDTRIWYAVGNSEKGPLKDNGWKPQTVVDSLKFTKDTTKTDENVYTLKMDIYAGDGFKFVYKTSADETFASDDEVWARQVGIENFDTVEGEGKDAVIKSGEDTLFTTKDGIDAHNLYCAKGQDGKYTFTLKTFPDKGSEEKVVFSVTKDEAIKIPYDMYVYGDMNDFGWKDKLDYAMTSANGVWSYVLAVTAEDLTRDATGAKVTTGAQYAAIQLVNEGEGAAAGDAKKFAVAPADGDNFLKVNDATNGEVNLLPEGKYVISFTEDGKVVSISEKTHDMYLIGSFNGWAAADANYAMTEQGDGTWTATITVEKDEKIKSYNKLGATDSERYSAGADLDLTAGTWAVRYYPETNTIKIEKYGYYLVGTFMDGETQVNFSIKDGVTPAFTEADGVYTVTYDFKDVSAQYTWMGAGNIAAVKAVWGTALNGVADSDWYGQTSDNGNLMITSTGEWTVTLTLNAETGNRISAAKKA